MFNRVSFFHPKLTEKKTDSSLGGLDQALGFDQELIFGIDMVMKIAGR